MTVARNVTRMTFMYQKIVIITYLVDGVTQIFLS